MKQVIGLLIFAIEFQAACIATIADIVIGLFKPFSIVGHVVEDWCERQRVKLKKPKETEKEEEKPQEN